MPWLALLKVVSLGYLLGLASLSFAWLLWRVLRPRIAPAFRADMGFAILTGTFLLNTALAFVIWLGVVNGRILMTTNYFHHLMHGGWSLLFIFAGSALLLISLLIGVINWHRGRVPRQESTASAIDFEGALLRPSPHVATLSLVGAWSHELWVNPEFWAELSDNERRLALQHERVHMARRDTLRILLLAAMAGCYAVLPWIRRWPAQYEADSELAVDDHCRRLPQAALYSVLVARAAEHTLAWKPRLVASHLSQHELTQRLQYLAEPRRSGSIWAAALLGYAVVLASVMPASALLLTPVSRCLCACYLGY